MSYHARVGILIALFLVGPSVASAQLIVSEIMYDLQSGADSGREWIEVFNASEDPLPLTEWKVFEGGSNHSIASVQGGDTLPSGAYAIIADNPAKFLVDWPGYAGLLYDTAFSGGLSNSGESITVGYMSDGSLVSTDAVSYVSTSGGAGDGRSLQRSATDSAVFSGGAPTPGSGALVVIAGLHLVSPPAEEEVDQQSATTNSTNEHTTPAVGVVSSYVAPPEPLIYAYAGKDRDVIAGADVVYEGQAYDKKGNWLSASSTRFLWNFGDGRVGDGPLILHHFDVPGRYAVVLSVANATNAASAKIAVNVHPVSITMSEKSGAVVLTNVSGFELDLSQWHFQSGDVSFQLPPQTTLLPRASAAFSASTTGITVNESTVLLYPNGTVATRLGATPAPVPQQIIVQKPMTPAKKQVVKKSKPAAPAAAPADTAPVAASSSALTAAAAASTGSEYVWWIAALALAGAVAAVVLIVLRSKRGEWQIEDTA